jgi:hypothetical protein
VPGRGRRQGRPQHRLLTVAPDKYGSGGIGARACGHRHLLVLLLVHCTQTIPPSIVPARDAPRSSPLAARASPVLGNAARHCSGGDDPSIPGQLQDGRENGDSAATLVRFHGLLGEFDGSAGRAPRRIWLWAKTYQAVTLVWRIDTARGRRH